MTDKVYNTPIMSVIFYKTITSVLYFTNDILLIKTFRTFFLNDLLLNLITLHNMVIGN